MKHAGKIAAALLAILLLAGFLSGPGQLQIKTSDRQARDSTRKQGHPVDATRHSAEQAGQGLASATGEAAISELRKTGRFASLGEALSSARHAMDKIDPSGPHSRGAEYFCGNPGQKLSAWFSKDGLELASSLPATEELPWSLSMRVRSVGRVGEMVPVDAASVTASGARAEMHDSKSGVTQWFENRAEGIEHGFVVSRRPSGSGRETRVVMDVAGGLSAAPSMHAPADEVTFNDAQQRAVLQYSGLKAWDVTGKALQARIELENEGSVALVVNDDEAVYPITIDPLFARAASRLTLESVAEGNFGSDVAIDGDRALVAADRLPNAAGGTGRIFAFRKDGSVWRRNGELAAPGLGYFAGIALSGTTALVVCNNEVHVYTDNGKFWDHTSTLPKRPNYSYFASSVAIDGNMAVVGDPTWDVIYIYERVNGIWSSPTTLSRFAWNGSLHFGMDVDISGESIIVASGQDTTSGGWGTAYVYRRNAGVWSQAQVLSPGGCNSVAIDGDLAMVGRAPNQVYTFVRNGGIWMHEQTLVVSSRNPGESDLQPQVALHGQHAVVGGHYYSSVYSGGVWVLLRNGSTWIRGPELAGFSWGPLFVDVSEDQLIVGNGYHDTFTGGVWAGSARVYGLSDGVWVEEQNMGASDGASSNELGASVALSGDRVIVGAPRESVSGIGGSGAAYIFSWGENGWISEGKLFSPRSTWAEYFGCSVALDGNRALVGMNTVQERAGYIPGGAFLFEKSGLEWRFKEEINDIDSDPNDRFGQKVAMKGDLIAVTSAGLWSDEGYIRGGEGAAGNKVTIFREHEGAWIREDVWTPGNSEVRGFGLSLAIYENRILVGAPGGVNESGQQVGSAYLYQFTNGAWSEEQRFFASDGQADDYFGFSVALSDGVAIIGAPGKRLEDPELVGGAYIFSKAAGLWKEDVGLLSLSYGNKEFGTTVAIEGDLCLVGAPLSGLAGSLESGNVSVFKKVNDNWNLELNLTSGVDSSAGDRFGCSLALEGRRVVVGSRRDDTNGFDSGSAYIFEIGDLPEIIEHPQSQNLLIGEMATFSVYAEGEGPLTYQWRKNGVPIRGATWDFLEIYYVDASDAGRYDCIVANVGGVVTSAPAMLTVNNLSQTDQRFPESVPGHAGSILVLVSPSQEGAAWRFKGEQTWRAPGQAVGGITGGVREVEFRPVPGYPTPGDQQVSIESGGATAFVTASYGTASGSPGGSVSVNLMSTQQAEHPLSSEAKWRLHRPGSSDAANPWRNSGATLSSLIPGRYDVEFRWVTGWIQPSITTVDVGSGPTSTFSAFYSPVAAGATPAVIPVETVWSATDRPYAYVGQLQGDGKSGTGFVVKDRVVMTAGHVVFDGTNLTGTTNMSWLFQRDRDDYEPEPLLPRGYVVLSGYADQWQQETNPGPSSSADLQELDVAALWFYQSAARGGYSGFLATDAMPDYFDSEANPWLMSNENKVVAGYPTRGVPSQMAGRMHATTPSNMTFTSAGRPHTYATVAFPPLPGASGSPLCVEFSPLESSPVYYPVAVLLGGSGRSVVRSFDGDVVALLNTAEAEGNGGTNVVDGGFTLVSSPYNAAPTKGAILVKIEPQAARDAGAKWRFSNETPFARPHDGLVSRDAGSWTVQFDTVPGFRQPLSKEVTVVAGQLLTLTFQYKEIKQSYPDWRIEHFGANASPAIAGDTADPDRDGTVNLIEYAFNLNPNRGDAGSLPRHKVQNGYLVIEFTEPEHIVDVHYGASWTGNPAGSVWTPVPDQGTGTHHLFRIPMASNRAFMRLVVSGP